jgi:CMP/dCMP kinase
MSKIVVAVDGPAGSGKSSVSKEVARRLGFGYLDTGAGYRALTAVGLRDGLDLDLAEEWDLNAIFNYSISTDPDNYWVKVGDDFVTGLIREENINLNVSRVASKPEVRAFMRELTRSIADSCPNPGVVVEGRDITTVVLPDAQTRVLLTASEEVRLARRSAEIGQSSSISQQVSERDKRDSKVVDFMSAAEGVILLDTTELTFEESVSALIELIGQ